MGAVVLSAVFLVSALASAPAFAQAQAGASPSAAARPAPSTADKARAADLFKKSVEAYRQGEFARAIELLDEAYALDPQPGLVYNRARAAEGIGDLDAAISGYEKFLQEEPSTPDRGGIEQRVTTLKRQRDERAALLREREAQRNEAPAPTPPPPAPAPAPAPVEPPPAADAHPRPSPLPYVVAGAGAVGLVAGTIFGVMALSKKDDAAGERTQQKSMDLKDSADGLATASTVSFVVGGILVAAGATWWLLDSGILSSKGAARRLGPRFTVTGIGGSFQ